MQQIEIKNIRLIELELKQLKPIQDDFKYGERSGKRRLLTSLEENGLFLPFIVWGKDNEYFILDGHFRDRVLKETELVKDGIKVDKVPCLLIEASTLEEAKKKLLLMNSKYQEFNLKSNFILDLNRDWVLDNTSFSILDNKIESNVGVWELKEGVVFEKGLTKYDIPMLLENMICSCPKPIKTWSGEMYDGFSLYQWGIYHKETEDLSKGVIAFYSWDDRFEAVWNKITNYTQTIIDRGYCCSLTPDFSVFDSDPLVYKIWQVYRMRYVGRYFQEAGIPVIPSLSWAGEDTLDFAFLGLPDNCKCVAVQTQNIFLDEVGKSLYENGLRKLVETVKVGEILVYGSPSSKEILYDITKSYIPEVVWCDSWISEKRKRGLI